MIDITSFINFTKVVGDVNVVGGSGSVLGLSYAEIGPVATGDVLGTISFDEVDGSINVTGGVGLNALAQIGPYGVNIGDALTIPPSPYNILFTTVGHTVNVTGGTGMDAFALIGQESFGTGNIFGNITFTTVVVDVNVEGAGGGSLSTDCSAQIGQFGVADITGDITFTQR